MIEGQPPLGRAEIEDASDSAAHQLPAHQRWISGDRQVNVRVDERRDDRQPARIHDLRRPGSGRDLAGDLPALDAQRAFAWRGVRELAAGDPEHRVRLAGCMLRACRTTPTS